MAYNTTIMLFCGIILSLVIQDSHMVLDYFNILEDIKT